jgi:hypothetical protein
VPEKYVKQSSGEQPNDPGKICPVQFTEKLAAKNIAARNPFIRYLLEV